MSNLAYGTFTITNLSTVTSVDVYYYNSTSSSSLSGGSWSTNTPTWTNGKYIWSKTVTTWEQGVTTQSSPVCITGQKGSTGNAGQSVVSITQQYALSTSSTTAPSSGWSTKMPAFESGKFYWTRSEIVWANPTSTTYTTAELANGITSANTTAATANSTANSANTKADSAVSTANTANQTAQNAVSIANGKNTIYYSSSFPTGGTYKEGDTLFKESASGYVIYEYNQTDHQWVKKSLNEDGITQITNAKIANLDGGKINAGTITALKLATDAIKSRDYVEGTAPYSGAGTLLDLTHGNIFTKNFGVNNTTDNIANGAYIKGSIYAYEGRIGSNTNNYWYIGDYYDYGQNSSAYIKGNGTATIQLGDSSAWRLNTNRIHTAWNDDVNSTIGQLHYLNFNSKYWDLGFHVPSSLSDKFIYIRKSKTNGQSNELELLQDNLDDNLDGTNNYWSYQFYVTSDGSLYAKNLYILNENGNPTAIGGVDGVYLLKAGGTITGDLTVNGTLTATASQANALTHTLSINGQSWTGDSNLTINTLGTAYGGTGNTSYTTGGVVYVDGSNPKKLLSTAAGTSGYLLKSGGTGAPTWVDPSTLTVAAAAKDGDGNVIKTTYLKLTGGNVTGPVSFGDSVSIDDLNAGSLVVTGNASFTNNINANTINGVTVGSSPKFTDTTYTFDNGYNASNNKGATVLTVTNAINALNVNAINGATNKTLTSISETAGKISATYSNISITKSQVSDFPTSMPASDVSAWAKASTKPSYKQDEILPLLSKTFTNVIGTENNWANATFFFGSIKPTTWEEIWRIKYRIKVFVPGQPNYNQMADVMISGQVGDLRSYASLNTIGGYYVCYYHVLYRMKEAGFNNGYGHSLGVRFYSAYNPIDTNYKRTIDVEILETENCTFNFYDNCLLYANIPGTGSTNYNTYSEMDFVNNGMRETGDDNDPNFYNRQYYTSRTTSAALYRYQICLTKSDGTLVPVNSVNNSVATNKTLTIDNFDPFGEIFFWNSTGTANANANIGNYNLYRQCLADLRYSFNCGGYDTTPTLTARMPLYLVATPQADGTAKLYIEPLSMYLPSSEDGLIYIYLGRVYEDNKPYRIALSLNHPVYEYRNGAVRLYTGLKSETAASGGTNVSLVTTGQKYLWNSKTNNTGTVTSVAASGSGGITIGGSPITTSGTLAIGLNLSTAINGLGEGASPANRNDYIVAQYAGGGTTTTTYHRRKLSNIFAALSADDIPNLAWSKITSGNDDLKAIENLTGTTGLLKKTAANTWTLDTSAYVTSSGVTSITLTQGTGISIGSSGTAITSTGTRTIALADNYGDTKNPYASKTARYVLAAPAAANGVPSFRALTKEDVGLNNVLNYSQITAIGQGDNGTLRVWTGDPTSTSTDDYEDIAITITAYNQSTVSKAGALNLSAAVGSTSKPVYFKADGKPYEISYTIEKSVPSNAIFTDTWNKVSTSQDGYVTKLPGNTTTFLRGDGTWGTPVGTTYTFDGTYNASTNKAATVSTVTNAINALDGNLNSTTPGAGKTLTAFSQTDGKISATFGDISISKSQITDFPSTLTPAAHTHGNISNTGTITSTAVVLGNGDNLLFADSSNSGKIERSSITIGTGTTKYLRQDGTWGTPAGTYSLPVATDSVRGGVKIGYSSSGKNYAVQLSSQKMYVNVPWSDTTYSAGTGLSLSGTTFANTGVTGVKGNSESNYRTGQVNLTAANIGAVSLDGNETVSGNKTFSGITTIIPASVVTASTNTIVPANPNAIIQSPIPKYLWHDIFAFCRIKVPTYYTSTDGENWTESTLNKNIFAHKEAWGEIQALSSTIVGSRWVWLNGGTYASLASWLVLGITYHNPTCRFDLLFETSSDNGSTWVTLATIENAYYVQQPIWIKTTGSNQSSLRLTITKNSNSASNSILGICSIRYLTHRWGDQGKGSEFQYPYQWDASLNIYPVENNVSTLGTSSYKWKNIYATTFTGTATSAGVLTNKTLDSLTLNSTAGTFSFQGSGAPWDGTDWVGLQVGSNDDKFQIHALNGTTLEYRQNDSGGTNSNWGDWYSLLSAGNYTNYTVTKNGSGASGTWGISITGNAVTATNATTASKLGSSSVGATDRPIYLLAGAATQTTYRMAATNTVATTARAITDNLETGIWYVNGTNSTDLYSINDGVAYVNKYSDSWIHEIYGDYRTGQIAVRGKNNGTWQSWRKILDSSNYANYGVTLTTEQTVSGRKTFENLAAVTFKPSSGTDNCSINYDAALGALVFSF